MSKSHRHKWSVLAVSERRVEINARLTHRCECGALKGRARRVLISTGELWEGPIIFYPLVSRRRAS